MKTQVCIIGAGPAGRTASRSNRASVRARRDQAKVAARVKLPALSRREGDVLEQLVRGLSNKGIGLALGISARTVEIHRSDMMRKLNAQSASDAVRIALYGGIDGETPSFL